MRGVVFTLVGTAIAGLLFVCPGSATLITWTSGAPNANQGTAMVYPDLTITAKSALLPYPTDPILTAGFTGTLYWGNDLGNLDDPDCGKDCAGLGVQNAKGGGSNGISGGGGDQDEAIVFSFIAAVPANSVQALILGVNAPDKDGKKGDVIDVYIQYAGSPTTVYYANVSPTYVPYAAPSVLDLSTLPGVTSANIAALAIVESNNHIAIGQLSYSTSTVPEPVTLSLVGIGLLMLGGVRRFLR